MSEEKKRPSSVLTKTQVYTLITEGVESVRSMKSSKEILKTLDDWRATLKPSGRGRQAKVDYTALQAMVDSCASKVIGGKASTLANAVAYEWIKASTDASQAISGQRIKELVMKGKLKFPDGMEFQKRIRKNSPAVVGSGEPDASETTACNIDT